MEIVWDELKRQKVLRERGYDLADIDESFLEIARIKPAHSGRFRATAPLHGELVTVIFKPLGIEAVSLVTMRPASRKER